MDNMIRFIKDSNKFYVIIENPTNDAIKKMQEIVSSIMATSTDNIKQMVETTENVIEPKPPVETPELVENSDILEKETAEQTEFKTITVKDIKFINDFKTFLDLYKKRDTMNKDAFVKFKRFSVRFLDKFFASYSKDLELKRKAVNEMYSDKDNSSCSDEQIEKMFLKAKDFRYFK